MELFLIDAIGPFFRRTQRRRINWSKIPFADLDLPEGERRQVFRDIRADLGTFLDRAAAAGFNAVTLDDVAHLADHPIYDPEVRAKVWRFREEFPALFAEVAARGMRLFVTMDVFSATPSLRARLDDSPAQINAFLAELIDGFLDDFPQVDGIVMRIGESDGNDVKGAMRSDLYLRSARMVNRFLRDLLPVFERRGKRMILRTWTVGAYAVGDLIWNRRTFRRAFEGIESRALVVSMKYGESDFFRFLPLNRNFFRTPLPKIIEVQARREYEGAGEFPSFVGWDLERYRDELAEAENMVGISVWCQTGGWHPFRRLAFLDDSAVWIDLNARAAIHIFKEGGSAEGAVRRIAGPDRAAAAAEFLRLSDEVIRALYYIEDFAGQKLFFRRVRIPPLIAVFWDTIFISHSVRKIVRHFVADPESSVREARAALSKLDRMIELAPAAGFPAADARFMRDTFEILALAREYFLLPYSGEIAARIREAKRRYKDRYPRSGDRQRYRIRTDFTPFWLRRRYLGWVLSVCFRRQRGYRLIDRILTLHLLSVLYRLFRRARPKAVPKFARKRAMGIDAVFR
ncbi:MAG: hypothetical protein R3F11_06200 [Verrucomicrobiales bacterium]